MDYINYKKNKLQRISISEFDKEELDRTVDNKTEMISNWISNCIKKADFSNYLLPTKAEFAYALGVSLGTIQNVFKILEDRQEIFLKQRIGAIVRSSDDTNQIRRQTSKIDISSEKIKEYIMDSELNIGDKLISARKLSLHLNIPLNTIGLAIKKLTSEGILNNNNGEITVNKNSFDLEKRNNQQTLVGKVKNDLKKYISNSFKVGEKLPPHITLADKFKVSLKTIHNAIKLLEGEDVLMTRRGSYGTIVTNPTSHNSKEARMEMSIFAPAKETAYYHYEKVMNRIKKMIVEEYGIGSKLPTIMEFSQMMDLNPNTIRKALNQLSKEGILRFARGRYGGIYVMDIPTIEENAFQWLAIDSDYINN